MCFHLGTFISSAERRYAHVYISVFKLEASKAEILRLFFSQRNQNYTHDVCRYCTATSRQRYFSPSNRHGNDTQLTLPPGRHGGDSFFRFLQLQFIPETISARDQPSPGCCLQPTRRRCWDCWVCLLFFDCIFLHVENQDELTSLLSVCVLQYLLQFSFLHLEDWKSRTLLNTQKKNPSAAGFVLAPQLPSLCQPLPRELRLITAYWKPPGGLSLQCVV